MFFFSLINGTAPHSAQAEVRPGGVCAVRVYHASRGGRGGGHRRRNGGIRYPHRETVPDETRGDRILGGPAHCGCRRTGGGSVSNLGVFGSRAEKHLMHLGVSLAVCRQTRISDMRFDIWNLWPTGVRRCRPVPVQTCRQDPKTPGFETEPTGSITRKSYRSCLVFMSKKHMVF